MTQRELNSYCSNKNHMWIIKQRHAKMTNLKIKETEDHIDCMKVFFNKKKKLTFSCLLINNLGTFRGWCQFLGSTSPLKPRAGKKHIISLCYWNYSKKNSIQIYQMDKNNYFFIIFIFP